jgi:anti-anti-sigma factor
MVMKSCGNNENCVITIDEMGSAVIINVAGEFCINSLDGILSAINAQIEKKITALAIDFSKTSNIDSSGIGILLQHQKRFERHGIRFACLNLTPELQKMFEAAKLDNLFSIIPRIEFEQSLAD